MQKVIIVATGIPDCQKAVNNLAEKINRPAEKLMRRLGETCIDDIDQRFMSRGYGEWPPLAPETIKRKKGNAMVLIDTGTMYNSTRIAKLTTNDVEVDVPFGGKYHDPSVPVYHQNGTKRMPRRRIIQVTPRLRRALTETVKIWIADMVKAFGKGM